MGGASRCLYPGYMIRLLFARSDTPRDTITAHLLATKQLRDPPTSSWNPGRSGFLLTNLLHAWVGLEVALAGFWRLGLGGSGAGRLGRRVDILWGGSFGGLVRRRYGRGGGGVLQGKEGGLGVGHERFRRCDTFFVWGIWTACRGCGPLDFWGWSTRDRLIWGWMSGEAGAVGPLQPRGSRQPYHAARTGQPCEQRMIYWPGEGATI